MESNLLYLIWTRFTCGKCTVYLISRVEFLVSKCISTTQCASGEIWMHKICIRCIQIWERCLYSKKAEANYICGTICPKEFPPCAGLDVADKTKHWRCTFYTCLFFNHLTESETLQFEIFGKQRQAEEVGSTACVSVCVGLLLVKNLVLLYTGSRGGRKRKCNGGMFSRFGNDTKHYTKRTHI